jgi:AcrR family transcriptional regulator
LDALTDELELSEPEDVALSLIAATAGVSLRTLYRYFPTRDDLFEAAGDHIVARLGLPVGISGPDDITRVFLESAARGAQSPRLVRSMLWTRLGRRARSAHRQRRVAEISAALTGITAHLAPREARRRVGAIVYLSSLPAWITVSEECGIDAKDARLGIAWALETLVASLREENTANPAQHGRRKA